MKNIFRGKFLNIMRKTMELPNGKSASFEIVEHRGAVLIIPFLDDDKIVLIKQYRAAVDEYLYEFPAGTIEDGEKPLDCAKREIIEETGYEAGQFIEIGRIYPCPGYSSEQIIIYKATDLSPSDLYKADEEEIIKKCIFTRQGLKDLFESQKITDSKTIAAMAIAKLIKN